MYLKKINIILLCLLVVFVVQGFFSEIFAREIDAKFQKFLLSDQEVPEYSIESIIPGYWPVGPDASVDRVDQQWETSSGKSAAVIILAIFDSEEAAIKATYCYTNPTQSIEIWGSLFDGILGLHSWRNLGDNRTVLFAYGNIGVFISMNPAGDPDTIPFIARAQIEKIDQNLAPEITEYRETLRQSRLSPSDYDKYRAQAVNVSLSGFTKISDGDSLWLMKDEGVKMGIRREWQDEKGRVVGIDICKLESNEMAEEVASERAKMSGGAVVDELGAIPWNDKRSSKILVHGNTVIHLYYFSHNSSPAESVKKTSYLFHPTFDASIYGYPVFSSSFYNLYSLYTSPYPYSESFPVRFSASSFDFLPASYLYSAILYNPVSPWFSGGGSGAFDYGPSQPWQYTQLFYPAIYPGPWRYYSYTGANIPEK